MYSKHIKIFNELSKIFDKLGDDIRATAYHKLAKKLELKDLEGITEKSQKKIDEISKTGKLKLFEDLKKDKNIQDKLKLTEIIGVGPALADKMIKKGIRTPKDFIKKYENPTQLQKMGIKYYGKIKKPTSRIFKEIVLCLYETKNRNFTIAGSYRTGNTKPGDLDLIFVNEDITYVMNSLNDYCKNVKLVDWIKGESNFMGVIRVFNNFYRIDAKFTKPSHYASFLLYFGSGKYFSKYIRGIAREQGYKLNQYGLEDLKTGKLKTFKSEKAIFKFLKIRYMTPRERVKYF